MEGGITTLVIVNLRPLIHLLGLWFEGIPGVVQSTEDAISNHPLLHCSIFNIELQKKQRKSASAHHPLCIKRKCIPCRGVTWQWPWYTGF
jgi:hypothetical protein